MRQTPASEALRAEHRRIEEVIDRLLAAARDPGPGVAIRVKAIITDLAALALPHFAREESVFYPGVRTMHPKLLASLEEQHEWTREVERALADSLESAGTGPAEREEAEIRRLAIEMHDAIQHHIVDEEDQLLRLADERLSEEEQERLAAAMRAV